MKENTSLGQRVAARTAGFFLFALILATIGGASRGWLIFWAIGLAWALLRVFLRRKQSPYDLFYSRWRP